MPVFDPDSDLVTAPAIPGAPAEPVLAVDEIQGNILPGFATHVQVLLGVRFRDPAPARRFLSWLLPTVSTLRGVNDARNVRRRAARSELPRPPTPIWTHVALSVEGLILLGAPTDAIRDDPFRAGLYAAASRALGDPRDRGSEGHVSNWKLGGDASTVPHVLVIVAADIGEWVDQRVRELRAALYESAGDDPTLFKIVYEDRGEVIAESPTDVGREHFGFRDGISTLAPRGRLSSLPRHFLSRRYVDPEDPRALRFAKPGQPLVWPGQYVFGYPGHPESEPGIEPGPRVDGGYPWMANGSLLVVRRLRQDVRAFDEFVATEAARIRAMPGYEHVTVDRLASMLVGRWANGTATAVDPERPEPAPMADRLRVNHFGYAAAADAIRVSSDPYVATEDMVARDEFRSVPGTPADPVGARTPTFAHVRKVNPRDQVTDQGSPAITIRSQVLRRGITFGKPYPRDDPAAEATDDGQRGLLFLAYQTSIEDQFELLSRKWMNRPNAPEPSSGHDLLVGQETGSARRAVLQVPGAAPVEIAIERPFVIPTGGGYFFSPSISALAAMVDGSLASGP